MSPHEAQSDRALVQDEDTPDHNHFKQLVLHGIPVALPPSYGRWR
jgi:hypothetical protein